MTRRRRAAWCSTSTCPGSTGWPCSAVWPKDGPALPIVFLTGHGDIPMSVQAVKAGAVDFLTKPVAAETLLAAVRAGVAQDALARQALAEGAALRQRYASLTAREREVLAGIVAGQAQQADRRRAGHRPGHRQVPSRPHHGAHAGADRRRTDVPGRPAELCRRPIRPRPRAKHQSSRCASSPASAPQPADYAKGQFRPAPGRVTVPANDPRPAWLLVDDEASVRVALGRLLRLADYEVLAYASGRGVPGDSWRVHARLRTAGCSPAGIDRASGPDAPAGHRASSFRSSFITASDDPAVARSALDAGGLRVLRKPFSNDELLAAIGLAVLPQRLH